MVNGQRLMLTYIPCLLVILNCFDAWHEGALEHRMFQLDDALHKDTRIAQFDAFCVGHVIMTAPPAQAPALSPSVTKPPLLTIPATCNPQFLLLLFRCVTCPSLSGPFIAMISLWTILDPCPHMLLVVTRQGNVARCVEIG